MVGALSGVGVRALTQVATYTGYCGLRLGPIDHLPLLNSHGEAFYHGNL